MHGTIHTDIYGPADKLDEVAASFGENFATAWNEAMDAAEEEYGAPCEDREEGREAPASVSRHDDKLLITVSPLCLSMDYGACADNKYGPNALENSLKELKARYPEITYEGVIAYEWGDGHSGDIVNYEISSETISPGNTKRYGFIGDILKTFLDMDFLAEEFWEKMEYGMEDAEEEDFRDVIKNFLAYDLPGDALDRILDMADEYYPDLREELESIIESGGEK